MFEGGESTSTGVEAPENTLGVDAPDLDVEQGGQEDDLSGLTTREITELSLIQEREKAESAGSEGPKGQQPAQGQKAQAPEAQSQVGTETPARLTTQERQLFAQMPPVMKAAVARMFKEHDRHFHNTQQQATRVIQEAQGLTQNINAYLMARPRLVEAGYTTPRLVNELLAAHMALENPQTKLSKFAEIAGQIGLTDQELIQVGHHLGMGHVFNGNGQVAAQADISSHPLVQNLQQQIFHLQQKLDPVTSAYEQANRRQFDGAVQQNISEAESLRNEKDHLGNLRYPKLFDDDFLEQAKPLVSALRQAIPGLSFGEALKRTYHTLEGSPTGNLGAGVQSRLPANNQQLERATRAALSARGRATPTGTSAGDADDAPPPEVLAKGNWAITEWTLNRLRSGARA